MKEWKDSVKPVIDDMGMRVKEWRKARKKSTKINKVKKKKK